MNSPTSPYIFSQRAQKLTSSAIREILKITQRPEIISFAGGLPAPQGFPVEAINAAFDRVLKASARTALQYGPPEGYQPLREWVADDMRQRGAAVSADAVLIVSGSQQALDMLGTLFGDPGCQVLLAARR